jgi:hypothetical protein
VLEYAEWVRIFGAGIAEWNDMSTVISRLRNRYKPARVNLLFIAESPPESTVDEEVRFFYNPDVERWDHMYRAVMKAVFADFEYRPGEKRRWLRSSLRRLPS